MVFCAWYLVLGGLSQVLGTMYPVTGTWSQVPGTRYLAPRHPHGDLQRLWGPYFGTRNKPRSAKEMSDISVDEIIDINRLCASNNSIFVATGVCDGWIDGVRIDGNKAYTNTILIDVDKSEVHKITNCYSIKDVNKHIMEGVE